MIANWQTHSTTFSH